MSICHCMHCIFILFNFFPPLYGLARQKPLCRKQKGGGGGEREKEVWLHRNTYTHTFLSHIHFYQYNKRNKICQFSQFLNSVVSTFNFVQYYCNTCYWLAFSYMYLCVVWYKPFFLPLYLSNYLSVFHTML